MHSLSTRLMFLVLLLLGGGCSACAEAQNVSFADAALLSASETALPSWQDIGMTDLLFVSTQANFAAPHVVRSLHEVAVAAHRPSSACHRMVPMPPDARRNLEPSSTQARLYFLQCLRL